MPRLTTRHKKLEYEFSFLSFLTCQQGDPEGLSARKEGLLCWPLLERKGAEKA